MRNFINSTYQVRLFPSVIPSDIPWSPPLHGLGSPQARVRGVPGQLYTQDDGGQLWCKGTTEPDTGWFQVAANQGHPVVLIGNYYETDPNGLVEAAGPAVWYGWDKSIWVKTDSANDTANWKLLLEFSLSVGDPSFYSTSGESDSDMEAP